MKLEAQDISLTLGGRLILSRQSLTIASGEITGLYGASGLGKSSLAKVMAGLITPQNGRVLLQGQPVARGGVQYVAQHPKEAMNPQWSIAKILAEAGPYDAQLADLLGVDRQWMALRPAVLSGGQLARIALLRALLARPHFVLADEVTAALDPIAQRSVWLALRGLGPKMGLGVLAISHDLALLRCLAAHQIYRMDKEGLCSAQNAPNLG